MKLRISTPVATLAAMIAVGLTAWTTSADETVWRPSLFHRIVAALAPQPALDSALWASLINSFTDPTEGMVGYLDARGDSLLRHPGAIGWGAESLTCQDSLRAGSGVMKVWIVTDTTGTSGAGTLRAAYDSVDANDNASTCQYIIATTGGNYRFDNTGSPNYDLMQNWRISGQMTQGSGFNYYTGNPRSRRVHNYGYEYLSMYRTLFNDDASPFDGASTRMNTQKSYLRHLSIAFGGEDGDVAITYSGGTEIVPQVSDTSEKHTVQNVMIGELDSVRPLAMVFGAPEEFDDKQRRITVIGNYMHGSGWRMPNIASANNAQFIQNVSYNSTNRAAEFGKEGTWDLIDFYNRLGPQTGTGVGVQGQRKGWPLLINSSACSEFMRRGTSDSILWVTPTNQTYLGCKGLGGDTTDWNAIKPVTPDTVSYYLYGIRGFQNSFAVGMDSINLLRGSTRVVACDGAYDAFHTGNASTVYCEADGDSIPINDANNNSTALIARWTPIPLANRAPSADTDPLPSEAFTDTVVARTIRFSGNSRYLLCTGEWAFRSDSVKTRFHQEWIDSTDAGDHGAAGGVLDGSRSYGATTGTACSDSDSDGMPNAYEFAQVGDSTSLVIDSMVYGRPAFEWYLDGRNLDATLVGCEDLLCAAEPASGYSFGVVARYVYFVPMTTLYGISFPNYPAIQNIAYGILNPAADTMMVVSCTQDNGTPTDSATIHSRVQAWNRPGINTATLVRDFDPFTGMAC